MTLQKRLSEATEGTRELDEDLSLALGVILTGVKDNGEWGVKDAKWTTSLDAALALAERVLPGASALMAITPAKTTVTLHEKPLGTWGGWQDAVEAKTAPLALCLAILKAKATASPDTGEGG